LNHSSTNPFVEALSSLTVTKRGIVVNDRGRVKGSVPGGGIEPPTRGISAMEPHIDVCSSGRSAFLTKGFFLT
jgi:hypothetical protein